jgi:hypothetical protein
MLESMRFKGEDDAARTLWLNEVVSWGGHACRRLPIETAVTWIDEGTPWARLTTEDIRFNVDVGDDLRP